MYLLFDIGGTKMRLAVSVDGESVGQPEILPTSQDFSTGLKLIAETALKLAGGQKLVAAAGGLAGPLNREKTQLVGAPHLPQWAGQPLKRELENLLGAPVFLENDTALAGLGEAVVGIGKGRNIVAYLAVGTGVGGARIVDGRIDKNAFGFEPGHQIIGSEGELENCVSGSAFLRLYGKKPEAVSDWAAWEKAAECLARGLHNLIVFWSPDVIVLGGSMIKTPGISLDLVRLHLERILKIFPSPPPLLRAELGEAGGLCGALIFLKQNYK